MDHLEIMSMLEFNGHEAYIVGGAVRDKLLGLPVNDFDLATSATPQEMLDIFGDLAVQIHSHNNAPVVVVGGHEVASFRKDFGQRDNATFEKATLQEDAERRDFTINALYENLRGEILDPLNAGIKDLECEWISFVGTPATRINEDPTRVLRAYRIAAQKGMDFHPTVPSALINTGSKVIGRLAAEQVGRELRKLLLVEGAKQVTRALKLMHEHGVLQVILPELSVMVGVGQNLHHQEGDVFTHTMMVLEATAPVLELRMAALFHDTGKVVTRVEDGDKITFHKHEEISDQIVKGVMQRLGAFNKNERNTISFLVANHMRAHNLRSMGRQKLAKMLRHKDADLLLALLEADTLGRIPCLQGEMEEIREFVEKFYREDVTLRELGIDAKFLISLGQEPGKALGSKLEMMEALLDKDPKKTASQLLRAVGFQEYGVCPGPYVSADEAEAYEQMANEYPRTRYAGIL